MVPISAAYYQIQHQPQSKQLMSNSSRMYNDPSYLTIFHASGRFPAIHDDIYNAILQTIEDWDKKIVFDLGSSIGLLSTRLARKFHTVYGIEPSNDIQKSPPSPNAHFIQRKITPNTLDMLLQLYKPNVIVARRVFPEIANGDAEVMKLIAETIAFHNIQWVVIEGRIFSDRSTNILASVNAEKSYFKEWYAEEFGLGNIVILKFKNGHNSKTI